MPSAQPGMRCGPGEFSILFQALAEHAKHAVCGLKPDRFDTAKHTHTPTSSLVLITLYSADRGRPARKSQGQTVQPELNSGVPKKIVSITPVNTGVTRHSNQLLPNKALEKHCFVFVKLARNHHRPQASASPSLILTASLPLTLAALSMSSAMSATSFRSNGQ